MLRLVASNCKGPVPGIGSGACREQQRLHDGLLPHLQAQGPLREPGFRRGQDREHGALIALIMDVAAREANPTAFEVALREEVGRMMLSWSDFSATLGFFEERYAEEIAEDIGFPVQDMRRA